MQGGYFVCPIVKKTANFSGKGETVNILNFVGHRIQIQLLCSAIIARKMILTKCE